MPDPRDRATVRLEPRARRVRRHAAAEPWLPDYIRSVRTGGAALYLLGWIGDYADAGAFLDPLFGPKSAGFGLDSPSLERQLARANAEPSPPARAAVYRRANRTVMRLLPESRS